MVREVTAPPLTPSEVGRMIDTVILANGFPVPDGPRPWTEPTRAEVADVRKRITKGNPDVLKGV